MVAYLNLNLGLIVYTQLGGFYSNRFVPVFCTLHMEVVPKLFEVADHKKNLQNFKDLRAPFLRETLELRVNIKSWIYNMVVSTFIVAILARFCWWNGEIHFIPNVLHQHISLCTKELVKLTPSFNVFS